MTFRMSVLHSLLWPIDMGKVGLGLCSAGEKRKDRGSHHYLGREGRHGGIMKKIKRLFKECPFFLLLISTGVLFTIIGIGGKKNIYEFQEYDPLDRPILSVMFTAINDDIYPWQIFTGKGQQAGGNAGGNEKDTEKDGKEETLTGSGEDTGGSRGNLKGSGGQDTERNRETGGEGDDRGSSDAGGKKSTSAGESVEDGSGLFPPLGKEGDITWARLSPLRKSTHEEYLNHISADIYGDAGVIRAASYKFDKVDMSYFDDALFIGDSRTVGLRDYTDLVEHADFYCETSLTIDKVMKENFGGLGTVEEALAKKDYGKIYLMVGINELGTGTTEYFMEKYTEVVDMLHSLKPEAKIFVQGIMRVSGEKDSSDAIYNNSNINARNDAIATLADNRQVFYIDVNEALCDEEGNLKEEYTFDQIHLLGVYYDLWKQFLLLHGVDAPLEDAALPEAQSRDQ